MIQSWRPLWAVDEALSGAAMADPDSSGTVDGSGYSPDEIAQMVRQNVSDEIESRTRAMYEAQIAQHAQSYAPPDPERNALRALSLRDQMLDEALEVLGDDATPQMMKTLRSDLGQFGTAQEIQLAMRNGIHKTIAEAHYARAVRDGQIVPARYKGGSTAVVAPRREPTGGGPATNSAFERYAQETNTNLAELGMPKLSRAQLQRAWSEGDGRRYA